MLDSVLSAKKTRANIISGKYKKPRSDKAHEAAIKIQRYWRLYRIMRWNNIRIQRKNIAIGITKQILICVYCSFNLIYKVDRINSI